MALFLVKEDLSWIESTVCIFSTTFQCFDHCFTMLSNPSHKELLILCSDFFLPLTLLHNHLTIYLSIRAQLPSFMMAEFYGKGHSRMTEMGLPYSASWGSRLTPKAECQRLLPKCNDLEKPLNSKSKFSHLPNEPNHSCLPSLRGCCALGMGLSILLACICL